MALALGGWAAGGRDRREPYGGNARRELCRGSRRRPGVAGLRFGRNTQAKEPPAGPDFLQAPRSSHSEQIAHQPPEVLRHAQIRYRVLDVYDSA